MTLSSRAVQIRDATQAAENTATRVGGLLVDMLASVGQALNVADYGALTTDLVGTVNFAAITAAIAAGAASGTPVTGSGFTYGIIGNLILPANTKLQDITLKQLAPAAAGNVRTLTSSGGTNITLRRVKVNRNGNGTNGDVNNSAGIWIAGGSGHLLEDVEVYGDDMGAGLVMVGASDFKLVRPFAHDINYSLGADPGDDRVMGLWCTLCTDFQVIDARVRTLGGNYGAGATTRWSRGITYSGCSSFTMSNPLVNAVDQGVDVTGSSGNTRFEFTGGKCTDCRLFGWKFANSAQDGTIVGAVAERCGYAGFVASGPAEVALPIKTGDLIFDGCTAYDTASNGFYAANSNSGFAVWQAAFDTDTPRGIRFVGCRAIDRQAVKTMKYGFRNEVPSNIDGRYNECSDCTVLGYTVAAYSGMNAPRCTVSRLSAEAIPNNTWTLIDWDAHDDRGALHSTSSNNSTLNPRRTGQWRFSAGVAFAANATGLRGVRFQYNGVVIPGTTVLANATSAGETALYTALSKAFAVTPAGVAWNLRVEVFQTSGGSLNLQTTTGAVLEQAAFDGDE